MSHAPHRPTPQAPTAPPPGKQPWEEPKLTFVEPTLTAHGALEDVTAQNGFFGSFDPGPSGGPQA